MCVCGRGGGTYVASHHQCAICTHMNHVIHRGDLARPFPLRKVYKALALKLWPRSFSSQLSQVSYGLGHIHRSIVIFKECPNTTS